jgi:hypothetical protein
MEMVGTNLKMDICDVGGRRHKTARHKTQEKRKTLRGLKVLKSKVGGGRLRKGSRTVGDLGVWGVGGAREAKGFGIQEVFRFSNSWVSNIHHLVSFVDFPRLGHEG